MSEHTFIQSKAWGAGADFLDLSWGPTSLAWRGAACRAPAQERSGATDAHPGCEPAEGRSLSISGQPKVSGFSVKFTTRHIELRVRGPSCDGLETYFVITYDVQFANAGSNTLSTPCIPGAPLVLIGTHQGGHFHRRWPDRGLDIPGHERVGNLPSWQRLPKR